MVKTSKSYIKNSKIILSKLLVLIKKKPLKDVLNRELIIENEYHGSDYGGWTIHPPLLSPKSIVYSFGIGEDITFDLSLISRFGLSVFAFDPTPRSVEWIEVNEQPPAFHFYPIGLADFDGEASFFPPENTAHISHSIIPRQATQSRVIEVPVQRLETIMKSMHHNIIDLLKMDIEGSEYSVIEDIMCAGIRPKQLLVEFHHHFPEIENNLTKKAVNQLHECGYHIFSVSRSGYEVSFLHVS